MTFKNKAIRGIESELLRGLLDYVLKFAAKKIEASDKRIFHNDLESRIKIPKVKLNDFRALESTLARHLGKGSRINNIASIGTDEITHSINIFQKKDAGISNLELNDKNNNAKNYSVTINYEENGNYGKLTVTVKKEGKEEYSSKITTEKNKLSKEANAISPYSITITYQDRYFEERLCISYRQQLGSYMQKHIDEKEDMSERVPLKFLNIHPDIIF